MKLKYCYLCGPVEAVFSCPKDLEVAAAWKMFCGLPANREFNKSLQLCEKHFESEDIGGKGVRRTLKRKAIPRNHPEKITKEKKNSSNSKPPPTKFCFICGTVSVTSSSQHTKKIAFFTFPKDTAQRKEWMLFCELNEGEILPTHLCSKHFEMKYINKSAPNRWTLNKGAVPTLCRIPIDEIDESETDQVTTSNMMTPVEFVSTSPMTFEAQDPSDGICASTLVETVMAPSGSPIRFQLPESSDITPQTCVRTLKLVDNIRTSDLVAPQKAKRSPLTAFDEIKRYRARIKVMSRRINRLRGKVKSYKDAVHQLTKEGLISREIAHRITGKKGYKHI